MDDSIREGLARLAALSGADARLVNPNLSLKRDYLNEDLALMKSWQEPFEMVSRLDIHESGEKSACIGRLYLPSKTTSQTCIFYVHGGGMFGGSVDLYDRAIARYSEESGSPIVAVDYTTAPEGDHRSIIAECEKNLEWLFLHGADFGVNLKELVLMGDSAGGAICLSLCLKLGSESRNIFTHMVLVHPMVDPDATDDQILNPSQLIWSVEDNHIGWSAYLGEGPLEPWAVISDTSRLDNFPSVWIEIAELDLFCHENKQLADRLSQAGIPVTVSYKAGVPHAFEWFNPDAVIVRDAFDQRVQALRAR